MCRRLASVAVLLLGSAGVQADVWDSATVNDNTAATRNELVHGAVQDHDLGALPGPLPDTDWYRIRQAGFASYEIVVDSTSADIGSGQGPSLELIASDQTTVVQGSAAAGAGASRSLRFENLGAGAVDSQYVRVKSAGCATTCDAADLYQIRAYDTTYSMARLNNSGTQTTFLILANSSSDAIAGHVHYWSSLGPLITSQAFSAAAHQVVVVNTQPSAPSQSGSVTISSNGCYGCLVGKAVAIEPATGFTFDTPVLPRPGPGRGPAPPPLGASACPASAQIQAARTAPDGPASLPICAALVTYVKPLIGADAAGFFIQADPAGPALFIAVDPATLSPAPVKGDQVAFTITSMGTSATLRQATGVSSYVRLGTGNPIGPLVQDLSSASDLVTGLNGYEAEVISLGLAIAQAFVASGAGFVEAQITTLGMPAPGPGLRLRVPSTLQDGLDLAQGCSLSLGPTPMWRFGATAEPSAWAGADVTALNCPAPRVLSGFATSPTSVVIDVDRHLLPASVNPDGSQFTFTGGLLATGASASGKQITVTTATQTGATLYTVVVASSVTDTLGAGIDPAFNSATFPGFTGPAGLLLNEVNPNLPGNQDLVELRVTATGRTNGITLVQNPAPATTGGALLATLPDVQVAAGDLIVVHLNAPAGVTTETTSPTQCADAACYLGAWDFVGGTTGITFADRVLALVAPVGGAIIDAVPFASTTSDHADYPANVQFIQSLGQWIPADCGGQPCTYVSTPNVNDPSISAIWTGVGTTLAGISIQRLSGADTNTSADWLLAAGTWGSAN